MSDVKRPRGRPVTRIMPMPRTVEYTEGCPGCKGDGYYHNVKCKRRTAEIAASAASAANTARASHVGGAIQFANQAAGRAANQAARRALSSSQVGGAIQNVSWKQHSDISCGRCKFQSSWGSRGSPGPGGSESSSRGSCESRNTVANG